MKPSIYSILAASVLIISLSCVTTSWAQDSGIAAYVDGRAITRAELAAGAISNTTEFEGIQLFRIVLGTLLRKYASEHPDTMPEDAEVEAYERHLESFMASERIRWKHKAEELRQELSSGKKLDDKARAALEEELKLYETLNAQEEPRGEAASKEASASVSRQMLSYWKTNRALYKKYGGRVIFQQAGPEPIDAYAKFLAEHEKKGTFKIVDKELVPGFWRYLKDDKMHAFLDDDDETRRMMLSDWWLEEAK